MSEGDLRISSRVSRRGFLRGSAAFGGAIAAGNLLAACGGGSDSSTSSLSAKDLGTQLQDLLGKPKNLIAKGPGNFNVIGSWPLTGPGSIYGKLQSEGFQFGADHVAAWSDGKLKMEIQAVDNGGGDPQKSVSNVRKAGLAKEPIFPTSYIFGFGAQPALIAQYKMVSLDPGGGTGPLAVGLPYCYGYRASFPQDLIPGLLKTIRLVDSGYKNVVVIDAEVNADYNNSNKDFSAKAVAAEGATLAAYVTAPLGATDYSSVITDVADKDPDVVITLSFGTDPGYQAREIQRQALDVTKGGIDFTPDGAQIAGQAFKDWIFSDDFLDVEHPPSDFSKLFVDEWKTAKGDPPENYNAAYYASAFAYGIMMDRILGTGGDINNGEDWLKALESDYSFPHVYGGNGADIGKIVLDGKTHTPKSITCVGFKAEGTGSTQDIAQLATYDIQGRDFKKVS